LVCCRGMMVMTDVVFGGVRLICCLWMRECGRAGGGGGGVGG
jgi:hypothetical protein